jgi:hypothetical protein
LNHAAFDNDPDNAGGGARDFTEGANNYNLTDERPTGDAAHGLQAFVQLKSIAQNPLSANGLGT